MSAFDVELLTMSLTDLCEATKNNLNLQRAVLILNMSSVKFSYSRDCIQSDFTQLGFGLDANMMNNCYLRTNTSRTPVDEDLP